MYEYSELREWVVVKKKRSDPTTREKIDSLDLVRCVGQKRHIKNWCQERAAELQKSNEKVTNVADDWKKKAESKQIHVFVDDSNLVLGAPGAAVNVGKVIKVIHRSRKVMQRVVAGSGNTSDRHWKRWQEAGYKIAVDQRRGPETFVDEALHSQLAKTAGRRFNPARTIALVTGDGNANEGRASFPDHIDNALLHGWSVELYSWRASLSCVYLRYEREYEGRFRIVYLDDEECE